MCESESRRFFGSPKRRCPLSRASSVVDSIRRARLCFSALAEFKAYFFLEAFFLAFFFAFAMLALQLSG